MDSIRLTDSIDLTQKTKASHSRDLSFYINSCSHILTTTAPYFTDFTAFINVVLNAVVALALGSDLSLQ